MHSIGLRRFIAAMGVAGFAVLAMALLWTDRAAPVVDPFRDLLIHTGRALERTFDFDVVDRDELPGRADQVGHALLWGSGMLIVGWAVRRRLPIVLTAIFMAGISLLFEFGQPLVSATRVVEPQDAVGNVIGIALATLALLAVVASIRLFNGDDREYYDERIHW